MLGHLKEAETEEAEAAIFSPLVSNMNPALKLKWILHFP